jgi:hypothetical protein
MVLLQILLGILLPIGILLSIMIWSFKNGIVPLPTNRLQTRCILENLPDDPGPLIFDLGSGFGTLAISIARQYPNSAVVGVESSPVPFWISRILKMVYGYRNLSFRRQDILKTSIEDASAVIVYLYHAGMRNLKPKLENELKPGVWIVSNTFAFPDWNPLKVVPVGDLNKTKIYIYRSDKFNSNI